MSKRPDTDLHHLASRDKQGFVREVFHYLGHSKKWWLAPILLALVVLGGLLLLTTTAAGPFLYTLF